MENLVHRKVKRAVQCYTAHVNPHFLMDSISPPPSPLFFIHTLNTKKQNSSATNRTYKALYGNENEFFFLINYFLNVDFMYFMVTISTFYLDLLLQSILNLTQNETTGYSLLHSVSLVICAYFLFSCFIAYAILTFRYCRIKHQRGHQQKQCDWSHIHIPHIKFHTPTLN